MINEMNWPKFYNMHFFDDKFMTLLLYEATFYALLEPFTYFSFGAEMCTELRYIIICILDYLICVESG